MIEHEKNMKNGTGPVDLRLHAWAWMLPAFLLLLAPMTWGLSLLPAAFLAAQLWRSRQWVDGAEVFVERGVLFRQRRSLRLADVQFVQVKPGLFGQAVDCGTVIVHGARGARLVMKHLAHPRAAQRAIQRAVNAAPRHEDRSGAFGVARPLTA